MQTKGSDKGNFETHKSTAQRGVQTQEYAVLYILGWAQGKVGYRHRKIYVVQAHLNSIGKQKPSPSSSKQ
jgi:hypothetical protein